MGHASVTYFIVSKEGNANLKKEKSEGKIKAASGKVGKNVK